MADWDLFCLSGDGHVDVDGMTMGTSRSVDSLLHLLHACLAGHQELLGKSQPVLSAEQVLLEFGHALAGITEVPGGVEKSGLQLVDRFGADVEHVTIVCHCRNETLGGCEMAARIREVALEASVFLESSLHLLGVARQLPFQGADSILMLRGCLRVVDGPFDDCFDNLVWNHQVLDFCSALNILTTSLFRRRL